MSILGTFFFISLGITFLLCFLLVQHFQKQLSVFEKKNDIFSNIMNNVTMELTNLKQKFFSFLKTTKKPVQTTEEGWSGAGALAGGGGSGNICNGGKCFMKENGKDKQSQVYERDEVEDENDYDEDEDDDDNSDDDDSEEDDVSEDISEDEDEENEYDDDEYEEEEEETETDANANEVKEIEHTTTTTQKNRHIDMLHDMIDVVEVVKENTDVKEEETEPAKNAEEKDIYMDFTKTDDEIVSENGCEINDDDGNSINVNFFSSFANQPIDFIMMNLGSSDFKRQNTTVEDMDDLMNDIEDITDLDNDLKEINQMNQNQIDEIEPDIKHTVVSEKKSEEKSEEKMEEKSEEKSEDKSEETILSEYRKMNIQTLKMLALTHNVCQNPNKMKKEEIIKLLMKNVHSSHII